MRFDQVRREFKKTLWGEELDNERYAYHSSITFDLGFLHQYEGKKYLCQKCKKEYDEKQILLTKEGAICTACF